MIYRNCKWSFWIVILKSVDVEKIKNGLCDIKYKNIIDNLEEIITTNNISKYIKIWNYCYSKKKKEIEEAFDYAGHRKKPDFMEHFKN